MIILATHKIVNISEERRKFVIGNTVIKLEPGESVDINLNQLEHIKKPVMRRALNILPKLYKSQIKIIDLQAETNEKDKAKHKKEVKEK